MRTRTPSGTYDSDIVMGEKYQDAQTGIVGVATAVHFYQFACERVTLEFIKIDGELQEVTFDAPRLTSVETGETVTVTKTGGPPRAGEAVRAGQTIGYVGEARKVTQR